MKNSIFIFIFISFLVSHVLLIAQEPVMAEQKTLRQEINKQFARAKKILKCAVGQECTQDEMHEARILLSNILAGVIILTGITVFALKKLRPSRKKSLPIYYTWEHLYADLRAGRFDNLKKALEKQDDFEINKPMIKEIRYILNNNKTKISRFYNIIQDLEQQGKIKYQYPEDRAELLRFFRESGLASYQEDIMEFEP